MTRPARRRTVALIVVPLALAAAAAAGAAPPDTVFVNGHVITVEGGPVEAFAVAGDRFIATGTTIAIARLAGARTRRIDLHGRTVVPGLVDSHDHLWNTHKYLVDGVDLVGVAERAELDRRLVAAVAAAAPGEVVHSTIGWAVADPPTRLDLDRIAPTTPLVLIRSRRGVATFNTVALQRLGVTKAHPTFAGTPIPVDAAGEPTGAAPGYPDSIAMIDHLLPPLTPARATAILEQGMRERNALGITGVRDLSVWPEGVAGYLRLRREGRLTLRLALGVEFREQAETAERLGDLPPVDRSDPWLFLDSVGEEPWTPGSATLGDYLALLAAEERLGWRPAPHVSADRLRGVTADAATDATLEAYEVVDRHRPISGKRWYLEHVPFATPSQISRMAALGTIVSVQDAGFLPGGAASLAPDRLTHENPVRSFLDHGLIVVAGSDYNGPTPSEPTPNNPFRTMAYYVTRRTSAGDVRTPAERIDRVEALRMFTAAAAFATFHEADRGRIAAGRLADFVVLDQDFLGVPDDRIASIRALATFVGGRRVYAARGWID